MQLPVYLPESTFRPELNQRYDTFVPTDASGAGLTFTQVDGRFLLIGSLCYFNFTLYYPATADASQAKIGGLPFRAAKSINQAATIGYTGSASLTNALILTDTTTIQLYGSGATISNATLSGKNVSIGGVYLIGKQ